MGPLRARGRRQGVIIARRLPAQPGAVPPEAVGQALDADAELLQPGLAVGFRLVDAGARDRDDLLRVRLAADGLGHGRNRRRDIVLEGRRRVIRIVSGLVDGAGIEGELLAVDPVDIRGLPHLERHGGRRGRDVPNHRDLIDPRRGGQNAPLIERRVLQAEFDGLGGAGRRVRRLALDADQGVQAVAAGDGRAHRQQRLIVVEAEVFPEQRRDGRSRRIARAILRVHLEVVAEAAGEVGSGDVPRPRPDGSRSRDLDFLPRRGTVVQVEKRSAGGVEVLAFVDAENAREHRVNIESVDRIVGHGAVDAVHARHPGPGSGVIRQRA